MLRLIDLSMVVASEQGENREIIRGINVEFEAGKVYGITGPNGGGKTSLAKLIMGIYLPSQGSIYLQDQDITSLSISERAQRGIIYAFQQPPRFKGLTVKDLINIARPGIDNLHLRSTLRDVGLCPEDYLDRDVGPGLSGGEMKRIEMAQTLARDAVISIMDEPEAGVDLWTIQKLIAVIVGRYKKNPKLTTIIITHNENMLHICDEILVIESGLLTNRGTPEEIWPLIKDEIECKMKNQCSGDIAYAIR
ncbi:MAG: ATP-binding cassette domain-containing protein [Syntrophomonadaceae bacterium]|jgi:Fe-S cluster assembly ATP-binding protein